MMTEAIRPEVILGMQSLFLISIAVLGSLSYKQRLAIKERDGFRCQHPDITIAHGGKLEVDHIMPQRWAYTKLQMTEEQVDSPLNLITECQLHHRGHPKSRHPDAHVAWSEFQSNRESFHEMEKARDKKINGGEIYWNDLFDNDLIARARQNTVDASKRGWIFPKKNGKK